VVAFNESFWLATGDVLGLGSDILMLLYNCDATIFSILHH